MERGELAFVRVQSEEAATVSEDTEPQGVGRLPSTTETVLCSAKIKNQYAIAMQQCHIGPKSCPRGIFCGPQAGVLAKHSAG